MRFSRAAIIVLLVLLTLSFTWPLLKIGYTSNMGSLEPATLVMARRVAEDGIWGWYPNWYLGFPFRFAGPPLTWWVLGLVQKINLADVLISYRLLLFASLLAFPISFYFLARKVFKSGNDSLDSVKKRGAAFISAVALLFLPSIGYIFAKYFAVGQNFGFTPSWVLGASASRSLALAILPVLLLIYWNLTAKINLRNLILAIFTTAIFFLIDGVTPYSLLIGIVAILTIEGKKNFLEKLTAACLSLLLAFLIDGFYFTPENIKLIALSPSISGIGLVTFLKFIFQIMLGLGPAILAVWWFKFAKNKALSFSILFSLPFVSLTLLFYFSNPDFLTEYTRFLPELEMGIALLFGFMIQKVNFKLQMPNINLVIAAVILLVTLLYSLYNLPKRQNIFKPNPDIGKTVEYEIAKWLEENAQGARVFLSGSTAFWLNEFAQDVWQVRGNIDQASTNRFWDRATYQIRNSADPVETLNWLKALRVNYAVVHDKNSKEYYHDFKYPEDFQNIGQKVYDNGNGDRIYRIDANLAFLTSLDGLKELLKTSERNQKTALANYVLWLEKGDIATVTRGADNLVISSDLASDKVLAVGITYDSGWEAKDANGQKFSTSKDPFGNLIVLPKELGGQQVYLSWHEGVDLWVGIAISIASSAFVFIILPKQLPKILKWVKSGWEEE